MSDLEEPTKYFAKTCHLRDDPEAIAMYVNEHKRVWPEVLIGLRECGVIEMKIWILSNRLFMYCECLPEFDPLRDWARYTSHHPRIKEWEMLMQTVQIPPPEFSSSSDRWIEMKQIFSLSSQLSSLHPYDPTDELSNLF